MWEQICNVQGRSQGPSEGSNGDAEEELDQAIARASDHELGPASPPPEPLSELPAASVEALPQLLELLTECAAFNSARRDRLLHLLTDEYLASLLAVFAELEITENAEHLGQLYGVVRKTLFLNDANLLELLLSDRFVSDVMGILQYDPDLPPVRATAETLVSNRPCCFRMSLTCADTSLLAHCSRSRSIIGSLWPALRNKQHP
eukprot:SAG31_NODE_2503_length_5594_cov_1.758326_2_plen_204_part_00